MWQPFRTVNFLNQNLLSLQLLKRYYTANTLVAHAGRPRRADAIVDHYFSIIKMQDWTGCKALLHVEGPYELGGAPPELCGPDVG